MIDIQHHLLRRQPFGRYQRLIALVVMFVGYQAPFISSLILFIYGLVYLNLYIMAAFLMIILLQYPVGKWERYINWVNVYINPILYFSKFERIFEQAISDDEACMFGFHPHSVFAYGTYCLPYLGLLGNMNYHNNDPLSRMVGLSSRFMLNMPLTGLLMRLWGIQAVNPDNLKRLMNKRQNVGLVPGGFEQATLTTAKQLRVYIQKRKGFIKYALKYNYAIYPTLIFNEHKAFWTFDHFLKFRMLFNKIKMPGLIFFHPRTLFFYPPDINFVTVVGKGLKGKKYAEGESPSNEDVEHMHGQYIKEVKRIYEKHKDKNKGVPLVIY